MTWYALSSASDWSKRNRWIWSAIGVATLWLILSFLTDQFSLHSLSGVAISSSFLFLASLGQTLVVTTGRGNIDLSIPSVITLSAFLELIIIHGDNSMVVPGLLVILATGLLVGLINAVFVVLFRIPAIITTLATGFILATAFVLASNLNPASEIAPALSVVGSGRIGPIPIIFIVALLAMTGVSFVLNRTAYGRSLSAVGQNLLAARLAGVQVGKVIGIAFVTSSVMASLTGILLGAYVSGAFLQLGEPYLLRSVGAVVLGGTLIYGGSPTALGTLFGSFLLVLVVTTMQIAGLTAGTQQIVEGLVIIAVLALASGGSLRQQSKSAPKVKDDADEDREFSASSVGDRGSEQSTG